MFHGFLAQMFYPLIEELNAFLKTQSLCCMTLSPKFSGLQRLVLSRKLCDCLNSCSGFEQRTLCICVMLCGNGADAAIHLAIWNGTYKFVNYIFAFFWRSSILSR